MRNLRRLLLVSLLVVVMSMSLCVTAFAEETLTDDELSWLESNVTVDENGNIACTASTAVAGNLTTDSSVGGESFTVNGTTVYVRSGDAAVKSVKSAINLSTSLGGGVNGGGTTTRDVIPELGMDPDFNAATTMLSGFMPIMSIFIGVIVTLITIGMTIFSAFDIAYIAFPVFRNKCEDAKANGNSAMTKTKANGETSLRFVTDDAQYAVQEGSLETGKSPWGIYFKKRVASYILLAIILFILMTGNINLITDIALKVVSGIMNVLGGLA